MLKKFSVKNFKAFKNKVTIDFSSIGNYEFNSESIHNGICNTAVMFGRNAGGKSALCFAIFDIVKTLTDNFVSPHIYDSYHNAFNLEGYVDFEYTFKFNNNEVEYCYSKSDVNSIEAESLKINGISVFSYNKNSTSEILINLKGAEQLKISTEKLNISLCRFIKNNTILDRDRINDTFHLFYDFVNRMLMFWSLDTRSYIGYKSAAAENIIKYIIESNNFDNLKKFFKEAGYDDELIYKQEGNGEYKLYIDYDSTYIEFIQVSSNGMKSLLLIYYWLENCLIEDKCPSFICIDEFDAFFHFELATFLVKRLKQYKTQVLVTTHNTDIFTNELLRPDCYYICNKNKIVNAHNATEKEIRHGHNLEKLYRGGAFGK